MDYSRAIRTLQGELGFRTGYLARVLDVKPDRVRPLEEAGSADDSRPPDGWRKKLGMALRRRARSLIDANPEPGADAEASLPTYESSSSLSKSEEKAQRLFALARQIEWGGEFPMDETINGGATGS